MKRYVFAFGVAAFVVSALVATAFGSSVVVESKSAQGPSSAGVYLENSVRVRSITIPLVIRQIETYPIALEAEYVAGARLDGFLMSVMGINYLDSEDGTCKQGLPGGFGTITVGGPDSLHLTVPSPSNPDAFAFNRSRILGPDMPVGSDGVPPGGNPSIRIYFTCPGDVAGGERFMIDTTCNNPAGHLLLVNTNTGAAAAVTFTPGTITCQPCACPHQCDSDSDGFPTAIDLQGCADILFHGVLDQQDPLCPTTRFDLDCDGFTTAMDLGVIIDYLFAGGDAPCDPCGP